MQPLLRPNVVVCASIIAKTSRDWVISRVNLKRRKESENFGLDKHPIILSYIVVLFLAKLRLLLERKSRIKIEFEGERLFNNSLLININK